MFNRHAAAGIAIVIASLTAVAAFVGVGITHINSNRTEVCRKVKPVSDKALVPSRPDSLETVDMKERCTPETVVFDNETLEIILNRIAAYHDCEVVFNDDASKSLRLYFRWNQAHTLEEVMERLNSFDQIRIAVKDKTIIVG